MASFFNFSRHRAGTVRSVKAVDVGTRSGTLRKHLETTLGSGTIEQAVQLPRGEDKNEWLAVNTVLFYNAASVLYSVLDGTLCNDEQCPMMNAGPNYEYLWADGVKVKNPIKLSAPRYVNALFDHVEEQLDDPSLFPRGIGGKFPKDFVAVVKTILKRLFRVYAHMYHSHFRSILALGMESHLNMSSCFVCLSVCLLIGLARSLARSLVWVSGFRHMIIFIKEFDLVDDRDLAPMSELISRLTVDV